MSVLLSRSALADPWRAHGPAGRIAPFPTLLFLLLSWTGALHAADPLSLEESLALAEGAAPALEARQSALRAAELQVRPAGELPDPELVLGLDNLPIDGMDAGSLTADFMTMRRIGVMQEFPRRQKRALRSGRAQAEVERESALLVAERLGVRESTAQAWIARWSAERRRELLVGLRERFDALVAAADAGLAGGRGSAAEALAARSNRAMLEDRIDEAGLAVEQARAELARWLPDDAERPLAAAADWTTLERAPAAVLASAGRHRELLALDAAEHAAQAEIDLAIAEKRPDWSLELSYAERGPLYSDMVSLAVRIDLPVFSGRRQDPLIGAKRAALDQVAAEREQMEREHLAALRSTLAAWQAARSRAARYDTELLPLAGDRVETALAAYRGGSGDLATAVSALTELVELQLGQVDRLADLGQAWAQLRFAFPEGH